MAAAPKSPPEASLEFGAPDPPEIELPLRRMHVEEGERAVERRVGLMQVVMLLQQMGTERRGSDLGVLGSELEWEAVPGTHHHRRRRLMAAAVVLEIGGDFWGPDLELLRRPHPRLPCPSPPK